MPLTRPEDEPESILVIDTFTARGREMVEHLKTSQRAAQVEFIPSKHLDPSILRSNFSERVSRLLEAKANVMVIMNYDAGITHQLFETLLALEDKYNKGTRRIFVSCMYQKIRRELGKKKRRLVRCIPYGREYIPPNGKPHTDHIAMLDCLF